MDRLLELSMLLLALGTAMAFYRLIAGPSDPDRVIGFDGVTICLTGLIVLLSIQMGTAIFFDSVLMVALIAFLGTVGYAKFIQVGRAIPWDAGDQEEDD